VDAVLKESVLKYFLKNYRIALRRVSDKKRDQTRVKTAFCCVQTRFYCESRLDAVIFAFPGYMGEAGVLFAGSVTIPLLLI
jgi:hypothetical protein